MREYRPVQVYLLVFAALLATAYVAPKTFSFSDGLDFRLIWLAGKLWTAGENPYGSQFHDVYLNEFGSGPNTHFWVYPPYWYPISVMLGKLPYHSSLLIWRLLNITLLYFSAHMVAQTISTSRTQYVVHFFFCLTFSEILQATAVTMAIGQTSILVYFGMAAVFKGWLRGSFPYLCLGIAVLALKPNVALPILAALLLVPKGPTAMVSVMAGFALAQIPISGLFSQWRDFGVAVARYSD